MNSFKIGETHVSDQSQSNALSTNIINTPIIRNFTILGERCSGTNFLESRIKNHFELEVTWQFGWKHWFQPNCMVGTENTLFIGIVRDPIQWLGSFYRAKHQVPDNLRNDWRSFLTSEWYSVDERDGKEIVVDRHPYTKEKFKNLLELRKVKARFLLEDMQKLVKYYILIRYEDLLKDKTDILTKISSLTYLPIIDKGAHVDAIDPRTYLLPQEAMCIVNENLDKTTEDLLGYHY